MSLFRSDAIEQQQKLYGSIFLARPFSFAFLTTFLSLVAVAIVVFFFLFGFTRKESVAGLLLPEHGLTRIYPPQPGTLIERRVVDGEHVEAGAVLFVLSGERTTTTHGDTKIAVSQSMNDRIKKLRSELDEQRLQSRQQRESLEKRRTELRGQITQITNEIALQQKRFQLAVLSAQRFNDLRTSNFVSQAQAQDKSADALDQEARLRSLERNRTSINLDLEALDV